MPHPRAPSRQEVTAQVEELYRRHLPVPSGAVTKYYLDQRYLAPDAVPKEQDYFGLGLTTARGEHYEAGDARVAFPLQSISKIFAYGLALADWGREGVLERVGVEPSGEAFSSLVFDEHNNRPFNPMVNAGALAATNLILGADESEKLERILGVLRACSGNDELALDMSTYEAELRGADRNRAIAYLMRSLGMLVGDVEECLSLYLKQCSVFVTCSDLAAMAATLANGGVNPSTGRKALPASTVRDVLTVMYTCGMYDFAGEWAFSVGVPAKSGVSGGVLVVAPGKGGLGIFSPGLDRFGNSVRGTRVCQELSDRLGLHLFATSDEDRLFRAASSSE
jgi:glutaminase